ncbi:MAG: N-acetylmuramoyl-L-alanine amidase [Dehalococcoidia bacterium]|jgi:hypothetical protein
MMRIDDTTYEVKENNRYKVQTAKKQIVIGMSLRKNGHHITRLTHKEFGNTKKWNTFTITRDGVVYQHYNPKFYSDFLGIKDADRLSISIVLENMGYLFQTSDGKYINWLNEECEEENVIAYDYLGYNYWERFTIEQIKNVVLLCKKLCKEFGIKKECIEFHPYHKDTVKFEGIVFRSNYIEDSSDTNPLFDIEKFNKMLKNGGG